jgi:hypothetical protein
MKLVKILSAFAFAFALVAGTAQAGCCEKAKEAGKSCEHKCCVEAKNKGKTCESCNPPKKDKEEKK